MEQKAIENGANAEEFMLDAAAGIAEIVSIYADRQSIDKKVTLFAGKGNNGGDGFCAALLLMRNGFEIEVYQTDPLSACSELCKKFGSAYKEAGGKIKVVQSAQDIEEPPCGIILDGLLGTGFKGEATKLLCEIFDLVNTFSLPIFSIDIPSGLSGDTGQIGKCAICADYTLFLGLPKKGFFIGDGWDHIGKLLYVDFGLDQSYLDQVDADFRMVTANNCMHIIPPIRPSRHKYEAGFVVGFSGSASMMGASILSGMGALKSGCGIVKVIHLEEEFCDPSHYPELIHKTFSFNQIEEISLYIQKASAVYVGPGLGLSQEMQNFVKDFVLKVDKPLILDADALNIMAINDIDPPKNSLLTPHRGEALRLLKLSDCSLEELMEACQKYVERHHITLILKGGPTFIFTKGSQPIVCTVGDPGMATAGSGDVLTGILASILAQIGPEMSEVAELGLYLHGKSGEFAAEEKTSYAMTATDLLQSIHHAWHYLLNPSSL